MTDTLRNAWGNPVPEGKPSDPDWVPEEDRLDEDSEEVSSDSNALSDETGDDIGDLTVEALLIEEGTLPPGVFAVSETIVLPEPQNGTQDDSLEGK